MFPQRFISASHSYTTLERPVAAPMLRRCFSALKPVRKAEALICGLGFYELYVNGEQVTKGFLAPYISNPDHILYYDRYDLTSFLHPGKNALGVILGNGFLNNPGGAVWDFHLAPWRAVPMLSMRVTMEYEDGETVSFEADERFRTAPSPILFDDLRAGEDYDARLYEKNWAQPDFHDGSWEHAFFVTPPRGEKRMTAAQPIRVERRVLPVAIEPEGDGWRYDFGENNAGFFELCICGKSGQKIELSFGETVENGKMLTENHIFREELRVQKVRYILSGKGEEHYIPHFCYFGYRYIRVAGITEEQAKPPLLTMLPAHSDIGSRGAFACSDERLNQLQEYARRSTLSNFYYFPTDCPHREKNGWTGDASLSAEQTLLNFEPEKSYAEWLRNIRKAQTENGRLPGIVPTGTWGYTWGNGPAWDSALFTLPYYTYLYRGDKAILRENAFAFMRYLVYIRSRRMENGLVSCGLGDWLQPYREAHEYSTPLEFTDSVYTMDIARKAAFLFREIGMEAEACYADCLFREMREAIRRELISFPECRVCGGGQTPQAMAIFYDVLDRKEKKTAFTLLLDAIQKEGGRIYVGILGGRALFHVLAEYGEVDLALQMMTRPDYPSFGSWLSKGATTLWEEFTPEGGRTLSLNHHCWAFISGFFLKDIAGIRINPNGRGADTVLLAPSFPAALSFAEGRHESVCGEVLIRWEKTAEGVALDIRVPDGMYAELKLPAGYQLTDRCAPNHTIIETGRYLAVQRRP